MKQITVVNNGVNNDVDVQEELEVRRRFQNNTLPNNGVTTLLQITVLQTLLQITPLTTVQTHFERFANLLPKVILNLPS